jgi:hypothetical protein
MPNNECIPFYEGPYTQTLTVHAGYAITGKTFVGPLAAYQGSGPALAPDPLASGDGGNLIAPAAPAAGGLVSGVASWDAPSAGKVVILRGSGTVVPITAGAAVAIGDELQVDATGKVLTATSGRKVGKAHSAAGGAGTDVEVELYALGSA